MNEQTYKKIFAPDNGSLLEVTILDTNLHDWELILGFLRESYSVFFSENGIEVPLPDVHTIRTKTDETSFLIQVMLPGFTINCHALDVDRIQFDLLPDDVNSREKAEIIFGLMVRLAKLLHKDVLLTPEFGSASKEKLRNLAVCKVDSTGQIESRLDSSTES